MSVLEDVNRYRQELITDNYSTTWREILGQFKDNELKIDPEYQRLFRWSTDQQTQYIESILLNIPSPPLFFAKNPDGSFEVIDGLQRVSTLIKFFSSDVFSDLDKEKMIENFESDDNNIYIPLTLEAGPIIESLDGYNAETLPETLVRTIKYGRISIILLEKESSGRARYEVFKRLNKQGSELSDQEIRNCTARIFGAEFPSWLRGLAQHESILNALNLNTEDVRKMRVEEMILRLLAFNHSPKTPTHSVTNFLDEFMVFASEGKFRVDQSIEAKIIGAFELISKALPEGKAFRFPKGGFSTNLFDIVASGVYVNYANLDSKRLETLFYELLESESLKQVSGAGSNTRKKMEGRIKLGYDWFSKK